MSPTGRAAGARRLSDLAPILGVMALQYLPRARWSDVAFTPHRLGQVGEVWIHHSATAAPGTDVDLARWANRFEDAEMRHDPDLVAVAYSWLVVPRGGRCDVVEGRGWGVQGGATWTRNAISVAVCVIGNYQTAPVPGCAIETVVAVIRDGISRGAIRPGPAIGGHRDAPRNSTACPGDHLYAQLGRLRSLVAGGPVSPVVPATVTTGAVGVPSGLLMVGSQGPEVTTWQGILAGAGLLPAGGVDGDFGQATEAATRALQRRLGVDADGIVGPATRAATGRLLAWLGTGGGYTRPTSPPPTPAGAPRFPGTVRRGSHGETVRRVQARLAERGWTIVVDGVFGRATEATVRAFQRDKRLRDDGVVGPVTWRALWTAPIT